MKISKFKQPIFIQYLFSYVIVLFIPVLIAGIVIYNTVIDNLREQSFLANEGMLSQIEKVIDTRFLEMANISTDLSTNPLVSINLFRDYFYFYSMRHLMNYRLSNTFLNEVFLYDRAREYFYTSDSTYSLDTFYKLYNYESWSEKDIKDTLNTIKVPMLRKAEFINGEKFISYLRPIPILASKPTSTVLYYIKENDFKKLLLSALVFKGNEAFIIDNDGTIITGTINEEPLLKEAVDQILSPANIKQINQQLRLSQNVIASYVKSKSTGLTYVVITPEQELFSEVKKVKNIAVVSFFIILIVGSIVIVFFMRLNYHPVHRIILNLEETWGGMNIGNGFKRIENAISTAEIWKQQNLRSVPYVRQHLLFSLLQGRNTDREEFNKKGNFIGLSLMNDANFVVVIQSEGTSNIDLDDRLIYKELESNGNQVLELQTETGLTLIVSCQDHHFPFKQVLYNLLQTLITEYNLIVTIGVGTIFDKLIHLTQSYIEASTAVNHKFILGSGRVIFFSDLDLNISRKNTDIKAFIEDILLHMDRGDVETVLKISENMVQEIRGKSKSLFQAKSDCIDVINNILSFLRQKYSHINYSDLLLFPDVIAYANFNSIDRLLSEMFEVCKLACEIIKSDETNHERTVSERISLYIEEHFDDYNLSIQGIASDFGYSVSYISKVFKEDTGNTIMDHVKELRLTKSKEFLKTTNLSVKDIVELIGYKDVSSFIRKFKLQSKMTPQEFRNYHKSKLVKRD